MVGSGMPHYLDTGQTQLVPINNKICLTASQKIRRESEESSSDSY